MSVFLFFFWFSLGILFYCYAGYGLLVWVINGAGSLFPRKKMNDIPEQTAVTLLVTAYNEQDVLQRKIENCLAIDYPAEKLQVTFITDGSMDSSAELISRYPSIKLLHQPERKGKYAAIKRAMLEVDTPIVVFSDANTLLNPDAVRRLVSHYADPATGGVAGEKKIIRNDSAVSQAEGLYWKYESLMKRLDAGFYSVIGAAGELFSIRTHLFKPSADDIIVDDFMISMQVCLQGYKMGYEPGAFAVEPASVSIEEEEKRKTRIAAGAFRSVGQLKEALNIFKYPLLAFQYFSRRILRWIFSPLCLVILFFSNIIIAGQFGETVFYTYFLVAQITCYMSAAVGGVLLRYRKKAGWLTMPFYFVFMNFCLVKGFARFLQKRQSVLWEKSLRQAMESSG